MPQLTVRSRLEFEDQTEGNRGRPTRLVDLLDIAIQSRSSKSKGSKSKEITRGIIHIFLREKSFLIRYLRKKSEARQPFLDYVQNIHWPRKNTLRWLVRITRMAQVNAGCDGLALTSAWEIFAGEAWEEACAHWSSLSAGDRPIKVHVDFVTRSEINSCCRELNCPGGLGFPGFPVELGGVDELHAPFFAERRTRSPVQ